MFLGRTHVIAVWGNFLIKILLIYEKKNKFCSLKNLKNTFGGRVSCKELKGIKNARNIAEYISGFLPSSCSPLAFPPPLPPRERTGKTGKQSERLTVLPPLPAMSSARPNGLVGFGGYPSEPTLTNLMIKNRIAYVLGATCLNSFPRWGEACDHRGGRDERTCRKFIFLAHQITRPRRGVAAAAAFAAATLCCSLPKLWLRRRRQKRKFRATAEAGGRTV